MLLGEAKFLWAFSLSSPQEVIGIRKEKYMKKKILCLLLFSTSILLFGCGKDSADEPDDEATESSEEYQEVDGYLPEHEYENEYMISTDSEDEVLFSVDEDGNKVNEYKYADITSAMSEAGYKEEYPYIMGVDDGLIYAEIIDYSGNETKRTLVAIDTASGSVTTVLDAPNGVDLSSVDFYNGEIYVDGSNSDKNIFYEWGYTKSEDGTYEKDSKATIKIEDYYATKNANGCYFSVARGLDEMGFILVESFYEVGEKFAIYTGNGNIKEIDSLADRTIGIIGYSSDYLVYYEYTYDDDDGDSRTDYYQMDFKTNESIVIDEPDLTNYVGVKNNDFYYIKTQSIDYDVNTYELYSYDLDNCVSSLAQSFDSTPGTGINYGFYYISGGNLYFKNLDGEAIKWYLIDDSKTAVDIDAIVKTVNAYKYGYVSYGTAEEVCPNCSTPLYKVYEEYFILDDSYSDYAYLINGTLETIKENALGSPGEVDTSGDNCEWHLEYPDQYCETNETYVDDVNILNDRFLLVNMSGYWYGGGAHGYPGRNQYVFDLTTGEQLRFSDFYKGTEEEFKTLVAEKVKADYISYEDDDYPPYFASSQNELYQQVYDEITIDTDNIQFNEDSVTVYFYPYDLASYADGFKEYEFTYQELFGTDTLTR